MRAAWCETVSPPRRGRRRGASPGRRSRRTRPPRARAARPGRRVSSRRAGGPRRSAPGLASFVALDAEVSLLVEGQGANSRRPRASDGERSCVPASPTHSVAPARCPADRDLNAEVLRARVFKNGFARRLAHRDGKLCGRTPLRARSRVATSFSRLSARAAGCRATNRYDDGLGPAARPAPSPSAPRRAAGPERGYFCCSLWRRRARLSPELRGHAELVQRGRGPLWVRCSTRRWRPRAP
jgi:hypothetical protein